MWMTNEGELIPMLAESWELSEDAMELTLHIRKGVKFHDGEVLNAEAVKTNLDRRMDPEAACAQIFAEAHIKKVSVVDEYTVKIEAKYPYASLTSCLTYMVSGIQSPKAMQATWDAPMPLAVGTGPFIMKEWVYGDHITLVRNEDYWGEPAILEEVIFRVIPDDIARTMSLETGEIDCCIRTPPADARRLEADPNIIIDRSPAQRLVYVGINVNYGPFSDKRVRQAMNYAVNKKAIVDNILGGTGHVSDCPMMPGIIGYYPTTAYEYNPEKAKALLAEAGYPDGFECTFYPIGERHLMGTSVYAAVAADLFNVGIRCKIILRDFATHITTLISTPPDKADQQLYAMGMGPGWGDSDFLTTVYFHSEQAPPVYMNMGFYDSPIADELMVLAREEADPEKRLELYKELWEVIMEDAPWIFLHEQGQITGMRANVKDVTFTLREVIEFKHAWIAE